MQSNEATLSMDWRCLGDRARRCGMLFAQRGKHFPLSHAKLCRYRDFDSRDDSIPDPALFDPPQGYSVETIEYHQVKCGQKKKIVLRSQ